MKKILKKRKTVFVGLSGGVDSSVAAYLLVKQGYNVVGVFIKTWQPDFIECTWKDERRDAMRVAAHFKIPFLDCDAEVAYKNGVAEHMINDYQKGKTPNPDVMCNREVKFGAFWEFAKKHGADFIATGHYAKVANNKLFASPDKTKDQSYFLWTLTEDDLAHVLFPINDLKKTDVRKIAKKINVPTAMKKDSQGVCFLGPLDMKEFLRHYIKPKKGDVINERGEIIGSHDGALFFTLGERHGFSIAKKSSHDLPHYVVAKNVGKNTITVSTNKPDQSISARKKYSLEKIIIRNKLSKKVTAQIRYHGEQLKVEVIEWRKGAKKAELVFAKPVLIASGQSVVLYKGSLCIGGGIVA